MDDQTLNDLFHHCSKSSNCSMGVDIMMSRIAVAAFLLQIGPLAAYPLVDAKCKDDPEACIMAGTLEYVSIYGDIGYEDIDFFMMLDEALPPDATFPRVFLNSYGGYVQAGIGIGRILRKHNATAESGSPVIPDIAPECSSACAFIAQGAVHRRLTHVGLHGPSRRVRKHENVWDDEAGDMAYVINYMTKMGATDATIAMIENTEFDDIAEFYFDPDLPLEEQPIHEMGFYDGDDQYFTGSGFTYSKGDYVKGAEDFMIDAANYGSIQAMRDLARYYTSYNDDVKPDFLAASSWLKRAADKGDVWALHNLGYYYHSGLGVAKDEAKAVDYYRQASKLGSAPSQNNLGWSYYKGKGVPKSLPNAVYWITKSAEQGEPFAYGSLCEISGATDLFKTDPSEAYMWCGLAMKHLPDGEAKDAARVNFDALKKTIAPADLEAGERAIEKWNAEKDTFANMRNVGDDFN